MDKCIVHYKSLSTTSLREVTATTLSTLKNCKTIREQLGGDNLHREQGDGIPEELDKKYHYHPECFKKFIYAKTLAKRKGESQTCRQSKRRKSTTDERGLFGNHCMICKKLQIKVGPKFQLPKKILTIEASNSITKAAEMTKDEELLLEIADVDLIAKEFKRHDKCYRDYTRVLYVTKAKTPVNEKGNFEDVCRVIEDDVISSHKCVSMNVLLDIYGIGKNQHQYRKLLKERLENRFGDTISFIKTEYHEVHIVISTECIREKTLSSYVEFSDKHILTLAARKIRQSVVNMIEQADPLSWPPSVDELERRSRETQVQLIQFLHKLLIGDSHNSIGSTKSRIAQSIADDIIYNISNGNFLGVKHCSMGLAIHSMTGQKRPIVILSRLGHSISYENVLEIETAQAEVAEQFRSNSSILPIQPVEEITKVKFFFGGGGLKV